MSSSSRLVQFHFDFFQSSCLNRSVFSESLGRKYSRIFIFPRNDFSSLIDVGDFIVNIDFIFSLFFLVLFRVWFSGAPAKLFF